MKNGCESNLRRCIQQTRVREETFLEKLVDSLSKTVWVLHLAASLNIDKETLDRSEWVVHGEIIVELLHQKQLVAEDNVHCLVPVALHICYKLLDGDVEFLYFA